MVAEGHRLAFVDWLACAVGGARERAANLALHRAPATTPPA